MLSAHQHNWMVFTAQFWQPWKLKYFLFELVHPSHADFSVEICISIDKMVLSFPLFQCQTTQLFYLFSFHNSLVMGSLRLIALWHLAISCLRFNEYWLVWGNLIFTYHQEMINTLHFHHISYLLIHSHINILTSFEPREADNGSLLTEVEYLNMLTSQTVVFQCYPQSQTKKDKTNKVLLVFLCAI